MKVYIVNYKETTFNEDNIVDVECGTCDVAYKTEKGAISQAKALAKEKIEELENEFPEDMEDNISSTQNENGDYQCVNHFSDTFEYSVFCVEV